MGLSRERERRERAGGHPVGPEKEWKCIEGGGVVHVGLREEGIGIDPRDVFAPLEIGPPENLLDDLNLVPGEQSASERHTVFVRIRRRDERQPHIARVAHDLLVDERCLHGDWQVERI